MRNVGFSSIVIAVLLLSACSVPNGRKVAVVPDASREHCVPVEKILPSGESRCAGISDGVVRYNLLDSITRGVYGDLPSGGFSSNEDYYRARIAASGDLRCSFLRLPVDEYLDRKAGSRDSSSSVKSQELLRAVLSSAASVRKRLDEYIASAKTSAVTGNNNQTVFFDEEALLYFAQLEEINAIIMAAGGKPVEVPSKEEIYSSLYEVFGRPVKSFADMMDFFAFLFIRGGPGRFSIYPFSFEDTGVIGEGGRYLAEALKASCQKLPEWQKPGPATYGEISGTYWLKDGMLHVVAVRRQSGNGAIQRILEATVPQVSPFSNERKPEDAEKTLSLLKCYGANRLKGCGRRVALVTSNGSRNIACVKGQELKLMASVDMPSYLRIIQYRADGLPVLLIDNYLVAKTNHLNDISAEGFSSLKCDGPSGVGFVQVVASPDMFEPLRIEHMCGSDYILETPQEIISNNRGRLKDGVSRRDEYWITLTIMEK